MTDINLLPWREYHKNKQIDKYLIISSLFLSSVILVILFVYINLKMQIELYQHDNMLLGEEIKKVNVINKKIDSIKNDRDYFIKIMKVIEELQKTRYLPAQMFDEIAQAIPIDIYLTKIESTDNKIYVEGVADTNTTVSNFIKNLDFSSYFDKSELVEIKGIEKKDEANQSLFKIKLERVVSW